ncbi:diguanylate cyclase (GGDEF) domain-containing protein [Klenkia marina]|uniref:Diguanylate cyclase (GGDEF) domain-containing protein n=1 Tax=Klenkia marina TaxID=1960309 RepID=A0A1G4XHV5_9ACTN|nr:GGDEF domain-containing protein [Klenkia marina]SCX40298.1 diguanylate cyclase (GGDEF) domain-containing protein [Klenkia marina]
MTGLGLLDADLSELEQWAAVARYGVGALPAQLARAEVLLDRATRSGSALRVQRARLVRAQLGRRAGGVVECAQVGEEVRRWAEEHGHRLLLARTHFVLAGALSEIGDRSLALEHAVRAVDGLPDDAPAAVLADHRSRLADTLAQLQDPATEDAYAAALDLALQLDDRHRVMRVFNNRAYTRFELGDLEGARDDVRALQEEARLDGTGLDVSERDTVACVLLGLGQAEDAAAVVAAGLDPATLEAATAGDGGAELLLTAAEVDLVRGKLGPAQQHLADARQRCDARGLTWLRLRVDELQARLHAARGEWQQAYEGQRAYTAALLRQQSVDREVRAQTLHALHDTAEARRETRQYRELSLRDPLTGLFNRRHVDEVLPVLLRGPSAVHVALVDLDHFKRVNDTLSHAVGDEVLRRAAQLLRDAVPTGGPETGGFAARMGGEEFLLVLVGLTAADVVDRVEALRVDLAGAPWAPLTGDLPVTASFGVAHARPGQPAPEDLSTLLSRADGALYEAKHAGRDRVRVAVAVAVSPRASG